MHITLKVWGNKQFNFELKHGEDSTEYNPRWTSVDSANLFIILLARNKLLGTEVIAGKYSDFFFF